MSDADCNCTNFNPYVGVHTTRSLNASSGQCVQTRDSHHEFDLLETGFEGVNIPYYSANVVHRPARVYIKAKANCLKRAFTNYTLGVVRVHGHFGIRLLTKDVYYMVNGSWIWADYLTGDFFDDNWGEDPFHEFIFDLRKESTAIYYNYNHLVTTTLHANKISGGIQLDGGSGPLLNFVSVYDNQCEVKCEYWQCDDQGNCICVDIIPTTPPVEEVEDAGLLMVILCIMITNICCLIFFTVFWRCYGKAQRPRRPRGDSEGRRSKRASSLYSRASSIRRSTAFIHTPSSNYNTPNPRRQSMEVSQNVGRSVKDSEGRADTRPSRPQRTNRRGSRDKAHRENGKPHTKPKPPREGNKVNREGIRPSPNRGPSGKPKSRHGKNAQGKPRKKANKKPKPKMRRNSSRKTVKSNKVSIIPSPVESDEPASAEVLKRKKHDVFPNSRDAGVVNMVEEKKKEKSVGRAKKNSKKKVTKQEVELTHVQRAESPLVQKQRNKTKENPPSKVGLVHEKRKDSEPKAQVEARTEKHASSFSSLAPDSTQAPPLKISFARSSSSSDNMHKDDTPASSLLINNSVISVSRFLIETCSPELIRDISREREQVVEHVEGSTNLALYNKIIGVQSMVVQGSEKLAPGGKIMKLVANEGERFSGGQDLKLYE